jgi:hypothetical protein
MEQAASHHRLQCPANHEVTAQKRTLVDQDKSDLKIDAVFSNFPVLTMPFCSLIHAPSTFLSVLAARLMPFSTASSKLFSELEIISVTRATDITFSFAA